MPELLKSINPSTDEVIAEYPTTSPTEVENHLEMAQRAYLIWRKTSFSDRAKRFLRVAELLETKQTQFAELMTREMGKPIAQAQAEIQKCGWVCKYYADKAESFLTPQVVETDAQISYVRYDPLGVILAIMPWNFPFWQVFRAAVPAISSGNAMILKHANNVSGTARAIENLFIEAGFPAGVFSAVILPRQRIEEVTKSSLIAGMTLTGSERAGRAVAATAGEQIKPTVLELGGSDPFIVLEDADLSRVIPQAVNARVQNSGQSCIAAKRFLVHRSIAKEFEKGMVDQMKQLKVGDPLQEQTQVGPMARDDLRETLHGQVQRTIEAGGRLCCGGRPLDRKGFFYAPTVLADVTPGMPAFDEETFGPVAALTPFGTPEEAIHLANSSSYGLGASIWTSQASHAIELIPELESGAVFVNQIVKSDPRIPFGGVKNSGYGRELGREGLLAFVNKKTTWIE